MNKFKNVLAFFALIIIVNIGKINAQNTTWILGEKKVSLLESIKGNELIIGFNTGQISHYSHMRNAGIIGLTKDEYTTINKVASKDLRQNLRSSGTVSNYQNLHEIGYGTHDNTINDWSQLYSKHNNVFKQLGFLIKTMQKNRTWIFNQFDKISPRSYLYDIVDIYNKTEAETMAFTFNSHMPFVGHCTMEQSLASLNYIKANTNLISVELENETYYADYIVGNNNAKDHVPKIDKYIKYLEFEVVPSVTSVVGKDMPLGISINLGTTVQKFNYWNKEVIALYERLTAKGYDVFLVPHFYFDDYTYKTVSSELYRQLSTIPNDIPLRITEYNTDSKAGNANQAETIAFIEMFNKACERYPQIKATYYHSLMTEQGAHFSYIK